LFVAQAAAPEEGGEAPMDEDAAADAMPVVHKRTRRALAAA